MDEQEKVINYFEEWSMAWAWLSSLSVDRRVGAGLKRSTSTNPRKRWMVVTYY